MEQYFKQIIHRTSQDNKSEFCDGFSNSSTGISTNVIALALRQRWDLFINRDTGPSSSKPSSRLGFPFHFILISYHHPWPIIPHMYSFPSSKKEGKFQPQPA